MNLIELSLSLHELSENSWLYKSNVYLNNVEGWINVFITDKDIETKLVFNKDDDNNKYKYLAVKNVLTACMSFGEYKRYCDRNQ